MKKKPNKLFRIIFKEQRKEGEEEEEKEQEHQQGQNDFVLVK